MLEHILYYKVKYYRSQQNVFMKIFSKFPTINISELKFWLVICIAKDFIWTTLKAPFFFLHPQIPDFQIVVSRPNIIYLS